MLFTDHFRINSASNQSVGPGGGVFQLLVELSIVGSPTAIRRLNA